MSGPNLENDYSKNNTNEHTNANAYNEESSEIDTITSLPAPAYQVGIDPPPNSDIGLGDINSGANQMLPTDKTESPSDTITKSDEKGTWNVPFDLDTVSTASDVKKYIFRLVNNASQVKNIVSNSDDIIGDLETLEYDTEAMTEMFGIIQENYNGEEEVDKTDMEILQLTSENFEESFNTNFHEIKGTATGGLTKLRSFKKINGQSKKLQAALQQAYYDADTSFVTRLTAVVDTIATYNEKGGKLAGIASDNISHLQDSKIMDMIDNGKSRIEKLTGGAKDVLEVAVNLETLYNDISDGGSRLGGATENLSAIFELTDKVINLIDLPGLNVIQGLWNQVYKPMIDVCIVGLGRIESAVGKNLRDLTGIKVVYWKEKDIGKDNTAPTFIRKDLDERFEGGWSVFNFMWNAMCNEWHRLPNEDVVTYFEENYDKINAGSKDGDELPYDGIGPFWSIDEADLMFWAIRNKHKLWAMFYGSNLPYPPKTT